MTLIISPPGDPLKPMIGWENLLLSAFAVTSTHDEADYPHENAYDWNPTTFWKSMGYSQSLTFDLGAAKTFNYLGVYAQTLWQVSGGVAIFVSDDGFTFTLVGNYPLTSAAPKYIRFADQTHRYVRLAFYSGTGGDAFVGVLSLGKELNFERGFFVGFSPPTLARNTVLTNMVSQNGLFLGRTLIRKNAKTSIAMDMLTQEWVRDSWLPFMVHAELQPFFLQWNNDRWPLETMFAWSDGAIPPPKNTKAGKGFMSAGINIMGNAE